MNHPVYVSCSKWQNKCVTSVPDGSAIAGASARGFNNAAEMIKSWESCQNPRVTTGLTVSLSQRLPLPAPALLTPVSPCSSIYRDLEKISLKYGLNYRLGLTESPTTFSSLRFHPSMSGSSSSESGYPGVSGHPPPPFPGLSLPQPEGPPHTRINTAILFRESAWSRCRADPIISTSDGLPGS